MPENSCTTIGELTLALQHFADQRDWNKAHTPKNLASALIVEAAELLEHFQWKSQEQSLHLSPKELKEVGYEMADVFIYLTRMADILGIDLLQAASEKIEINAIKYPAKKA